MIPIKIQCGCGQRYAFDIEPAQGQMPYTVACPTCGIDGTQAANQFLVQTNGAQFATATLPEPVSAPLPRNPGRPAPNKEIDLIQVTHEARAKTMWGDEQPDVVKFLMLKGLPTKEAQKLAQALFAERATTIRGTGVMKIVTGVGLMCVPVATFFTFIAMGFKSIPNMPLKLLGFAGAIGLWGAYRTLKGTIMFFAPKSEPGDVSSQ
jgi:hypothetical protein